MWRLIHCEVREPPLVTLRVTSALSWLPEIVARHSALRPRSEQALSTASK